MERKKQAKKIEKKGNFFYGTEMKIFVACYEAHDFYSYFY